MKIIIANTGQEILVDDEDFEQLKRHKWHISDGYACRCTKIKGKKLRLRMHRLVMGLLPGTEDARVVDHKNGNRLDNRKENLRVCTKSQNEHNRQVRSDSKSGYKGVITVKDGWTALIKLNGKRKYLGFFKSPEEAALAYNKAAKELHGEFAVLNIVET